MCGVCIPANTQIHKHTNRHSRLHSQICIYEIMLQYIQKCLYRYIYCVFKVI
uniref:Uncharacterized protein n=1 Tax=Octopus bimaculoides TaxID=37653 RepID=A0A0L8HUB1_OCTBM